METNAQLLWILDGQTPVPCTDPLVWGRWYERADRTIAKDTIGTYIVWTVFLGNNQRLGKGAPILFETMVFCDDKPQEQYGRRYSSWDEALEGHQAIMVQVEANME